MNTINVLVVEDCKLALAVYEENLDGMLGVRGKVKLHIAKTLQDAEKIFDNQNGDFDIVALDGTLPDSISRFPDTTALGAHIRLTTNAVLLSISDDRGHRESLSKMGATVLPDKLSLLGEVSKLIN